MKHHLRSQRLLLTGFLSLFAHAINIQAADPATLTIANVESTFGSDLLVPVTATVSGEFSMFELNIEYDNTVLQLNAVTNVHPSLPGLMDTTHASEGYVSLNFMVGSAFTLPPNTKLFDLAFSFCSDMEACIEAGGSASVFFSPSRINTLSDADEFFNPIDYDLTLNNGSVYSNESFYTLTINAVGEGSVYADGDLYTEPITYLGGINVALLASPDTDWRFLQWSDDLAGNQNPANLLMNGNKTVTAEFTDEPFPQAVLTINKTGNGTVRVNGVVYSEPLSFDEGTKVTLTAEPDEGHEFTGWGGDLSGSASPHTLTMNADKNVDAVFSIKQYTLTINTSGNGSGTVLVDGEPYAPPLVLNHGTTIELQAVPGEFSNFGGWSDALGGTTNPQSITMDGNKTATAGFLLKQYTLTINTNGNGSVRINGASYTGPITLNHGDNPSIQAFQATGWDFTGWSDDLSGTGNPQNLLMDGNKTVTANFTIKQYTLTIETNGNGTVLVNDIPYTDPITYNHGSTPTLHAIPDENWRFDNWSGALGGSNTPQTLLMNGNKTVTANFSLKQYTLTIHASNGGSVTVNGTTYNNPITFDHGSTPTLEAIPNAFHHFDGWSGDLTDTTNPQQISMTENRVVYATFSPFQYTLTIETSGSGSVLVDDTPYPGQITFSHGDTPTLQANGGEGWRFSFWSNDLAGSINPVTLLMDGNKNITAHFELRQYTLTINKFGGGSVLVDGVSYNNPMVFTHGDTPALMAIPAEFHSFDGWSGHLAGMINPQNIFMDDNKTVDAFFSPFQYTLEVDVDGLGHVEVNGVPYTIPQVFDHGQTPTLAAYAGEDWQFDGWNDDLSGTLNPQNLLMDNNKKVSAHFSEIPPELYTLTVASTEGGHVLVNDQMFTSPQGHIEGSELALMAVPDQGWTFSGWSGDASGTKTQITLQMDDNKAVLATFVREEYTLSVNFSGQGEVLVNGDLYAAPIVFSFEDMPAIEAIPGEGWLFEGWSGDLTSVDNPTTMLVDGNKTITANFALKQYTLTIETQGAGSLLVDGIPYTSTLSFSHGVTIDLQAIPEEGWDFESWQGDLHSNDNPANLLMDDDKEITALFAIRQYNLTIETVGQGNVTIDGATYTQTLVFDHGDSPVLHAKADEGWLFKGWTGDITGDENPITLHMDGIKVVTAVFVEIPPATFTLTITPFGKGSVKVNDTDYITPMTFSEGTILNLEAMPDEGWFFDGWELDLGGDQNPAELLMDSDKTVAAFFLEIPPATFTLTIATTGNGKVLVNGDEYTDPLVFEKDETPTLEAVADDGWKFEGWLDDLDGNENPTNVPIDSDKKITALFGEIPPVTHWLTIVVLGQGKVLVDGEEYTGAMTIVKGTAVEIEAIPEEGWLFQSWNSDLAGSNNPETLLVDADKIVDVRFARQEHTLTLASSGNGLILVNGQMYTAPIALFHNEVAVIEAVPANDWYFHEWSDDHVGDENPANITMDSDKSVNASFLKIPPAIHTLTLNIEGNGKIYVNEEEYSEPLGFEEGSSVMLRAEPGESHQFDGWSGDLTRDNPEETLAMMTDKNITATFSVTPNPLFSIRLVVGKKDSTPIPDASVTLNNTAYPAGKYLFEELPAGEYEYVVSREGFHGTSGTVNLIDDDVVETVILNADDVSVGIIAANSIRAYPIPARTHLQVESNMEMKQLQLLNMMGQVVMTELPASPHHHRLDLQNLQNGIYMLLVAGDNETHIVRIQINN